MTTCTTCGTRNAPMTVSCTTCGHALSPGFSPSPASAQIAPPASSTQVEETRTNSVSASLFKPLFLAAWGGGGGLAGSIAAEAFEASANTPQPMLKLFVTVGLWFAVIGCLVAFGIAVGQSWYLGRKRVDRGALLTAVFGFGVAFFAGAIAQVTYTLVGPTELLRDLCWGIAGALVGGALSFRIPNLGFARGLFGGLVGGLLGGGLFILCAYTLSDFLGRLIGSAAIGFMIGLVIAISEALFREAWLEIHYGPRESRNVNLGSKAIQIGSDSNVCDVFVRGALPIAYIYALSQKRITCTDVATGRMSYPAPGSSQTVGTVSIVVRGA
jgi:hypothetical protein